MLLDSTYTRYLRVRFLESESTLMDARVWGRGGWKMQQGAGDLVSIKTILGPYLPLSDWETLSKLFTVSLASVFLIWKMGMRRVVTTLLVVGRIKPT